MQNIKVAWERVRGFLKHKDVCLGGMYTTTSFVTMFYAMVGAIVLCGFSISQTGDQFVCRDMRTGVDIPADHRTACERLQYGIGLVDQKDDMKVVQSVSTKNMPLVSGAMAAMMVAIFVCKILCERYKNKLYDAMTSDQNLVTFLINNFGSFGYLYWQSCMLQVMLVILDIVCLVILNTLMLNGRIWDIVLEYPMEVNTVDFMDMLSQVFGVVTRCDITPAEHLVGMASVHYACFNYMGNAYQKITLFMVVFFTVHFVISLVTLTSKLLQASKCLYRKRVSIYRQMEDRIFDHAAVGDNIAIDVLFTRMSGREYDQFIKHKTLYNDASDLEVVVVPTTTILPPPPSSSSP